MDSNYINYLVRPIGIVESCFKEKFGTPRQANLVDSAEGRIRLLPPFADENAFAGLADCSHLWLQFIFHQNRDQSWRPKVRPPRLGGNASIGVFATRSPYRPNALGLSAVRHRGLVREGQQLYLSYLGGDLIEGTPIVDIKPYVPYADCHSDAFNRFADESPVKVDVEFLPQAEAECLTWGGEALRLLVTQVLAQDPRPQYQQATNGRVYGLRIDCWHVRWIAKSDRDRVLYITVIEISE